MMARVPRWLRHPWFEPDPINEIRFHLARLKEARRG